MGRQTTQFIYPDKKRVIEFDRHFIDIIGFGPNIERER